MHINTQTTHNSSNRSGEWLTPDSKRQLLNSLQWPIYFINLVDNTKLPCYTLPTWKIWFQLSGLYNEIPQSVKIPVDGAVRFAIAFLLECNLSVTFISRPKTLTIHENRLAWWSGEVLPFSMWQNLVRSRNQLDCRIYRSTRALLEKNIANVFSLSVWILCSFLVRKLNSMIIDHHADSIFVEQENCNFPGLFWHRKKCSPSFIWIILLSSLD